MARSMARLRAVGAAAAVVAVVAVLGLGDGAAAVRLAERAARLQEEARAVSASHRQVLVKVVCNYRRTDDLNPSLCISVVHALNLAAARSRVRAYRLVDSAPVLGAQSLVRCRL